MCTCQSFIDAVWQIYFFVKNRNGLELYMAELQSFFLFKKA